MDGERKAGNELLAISHNVNLSDGRMFPIEVDFKGRSIDAAYAASRDRNEKLTETKQVKGASETHPLLSPTDEFSGFEIWSNLLGDPSGCVPHIVGSYAWRVGAPEAKLTRGSEPPSSIRGEMSP